jgi:hypothetical protein
MLWTITVIDAELAGEPEPEAAAQGQASVARTIIAAKVGRAPQPGGRSRAQRK